MSGDDAAAELPGERAPARPSCDDGPADRSMRGAGRWRQRVYQHLERVGLAAADQLIVRGGTKTLRVATALARLDQGWLPGPDPRIVAAVLGPMRRRRSVHLARQLAVHKLRTRLLRRLRQLSAGPDPLAALVRLGDVESLRALRSRGGPAVLVTCHAGSFQAVSEGLSQLGLSALVLRGRPLHNRLPAGMELQTTWGGTQRAVALKLAIDRLRAGGLVLMACDSGGTLGVEVLGRQRTVARGCFVLARITRAPLIPVAAFWSPRGFRIDLRSWAPLPTPGRDLAPERFEAALAAEATRWWEGCLRAAPDQIPLWQLQTLARSPRLQGAGAVTAGGSR